MRGLGGVCRQSPCQGGFVLDQQDSPCSTAHEGRGLVLPTAPFASLNSISAQKAALVPVAGQGGGEQGWRVGGIPQEAMPVYFTLVWKSLFSLAPSLGLWAHLCLGLN